MKFNFKNDIFFLVARREFLVGDILRKNVKKHVPITIRCGRWRDYKYLLFLILNKQNKFEINE